MFHLQLRYLQRNGDLHISKPDFLLYVYQRVNLHLPSFSHVFHMILQFSNGFSYGFHSFTRGKKHQTPRDPGDTGPRPAVPSSSLGSSSSPSHHRSCRNTTYHVLATWFQHIGGKKQVVAVPGKNRGTGRIWEKWSDGNGHILGSYWDILRIMSYTSMNNCNKIIGRSVSISWWDDRSPICTFWATSQWRRWLGTMISYIQGGAP